MRLLMIEDDAAVAHSIKLMLEADDMIVDVCEDGEEALELAKLCDYELIVMDLGLPDMSGIDVIRRLRRSKISTPVIVVSGLQDTETKVAALHSGADDYVVKPFRKAELLARIQAVSRRAHGYAESRLAIGDLTIDLDARAVTMGERSIVLTGKEFQLLHLLALRKGRATTRDSIVSWLYGDEDPPTLKVIDVFVCKLRKKLGEQHRIETVWGGGYILRDGNSAQPVNLAPAA
jgi:two-component system cell cycle response regulator CtrA